MKNSRYERRMEELLSLSARQDYLEKEAASRDPVRALAEFVWNSLDADASIVDVIFLRNPLGGLEGIEVRDNGTGLPLGDVAHDFGNLGDSWKRRAQKTKEHSRAVHGREGRGRLKFYSFAERARWDTTFQAAEGLRRYSITIRAAALDNARVSEVSAGEHRGTIVALRPLKDGAGALLSDKARNDFAVIFAPYLMRYPNVTISYEGVPIDARAAIHRQEQIAMPPVNGPGRIIDDLQLSVVEWNNGIEDRQINFGDTNSVVLGSQAANVTAPDFAFSAYAYSAFFRELSDANLLDLEGLNDPDFSEVLKAIRGALTDYFRRRISERASGLIDELKEQGVYPYEGEAQNAAEKRERQVFDIATHAVSTYSREFKSADKSVQRLTLNLLKEAVRHNPDSLTDILHSVVKLPKNKQDEFANLLRKTELSNVITASSLIAERVSILSVLKKLVFDPALQRKVKERGQLDEPVRDSTWLFGEQFHISVHEAGLTKIMQRVASDLQSGRKVRKIKTIEGKTGRVDTFLGRAIPQSNKLLRDYLVVELKKPGLTVSTKELDQVERYAQALRDQPDFKHTLTTWNFFLVTSEYDAIVENRVTQRNKPSGLFIEGENYNIWVKTWAELIRESEARMDFVLQELAITVDDEEIDRRIAEVLATVQR